MDRNGIVASRAGAVEGKPTMQWREQYDAAKRFEAFVAEAKDNQELWRAVYRLATIPPHLIERARAIPCTQHLLVLAEDWCGDAWNTVPLAARLAEAAPKLDLRILSRDEHPEVMNAHLTNGARSIPVIMVLDERFHECGWWGPRPRELQEWVLTTGLTLDHRTRYRTIRSWYARDRGRTTLEELVSLLERCAQQCSESRDRSPAALPPAA